MSANKYLLLTSSADIFYLTGIPSNNLVHKEILVLFTPFELVVIASPLLSTKTLKNSSSSQPIRLVVPNIGTSIWDTLLGQIQSLQIPPQGINFDPEFTSYTEWEYISAKLQGMPINPLVNSLKTLRQIKTKLEINYLKKAQNIAQKSFDLLIPLLKVGQTEIEIAEKLRQILISFDACELSFPTIVAIGSSSAIPHHIPSKKKLQKNDPLLIDFGILQKGLHGDMTRMHFFGTPTIKYQNILNLVTLAKNRAKNIIRKNIQANEIFMNTVEVFENAGVREFFTHSLGHGVGYEIHESPHIGAVSKDNLEEGMVFSLEPGLYFPGEFGVRLEDLYTIVDNEAKLLI